jgi:hypothetical protein
MALLRKRRHDDIDPFSDLLFNTLIGVVLMFVLAYISINPKAKTGVIDAKAEFMITTTWPDNNPNDVDTWVEDPGGNRVWFRSREAGMMHLDRDDRGLANDSIIVDGKEIVNPLNQEVVTIRGFMPGEYTVNVHYYESKNKEPVPITVSVVKVNPRAVIVFNGSTTLQRVADEATLVRFRVDALGEVHDINTLPKKLVDEAQ